jgi:hypothetical protein
MQTLVSQLENPSNDRRVGTIHLSLYVALLQSQEEQGGVGIIYIRRETVMKRARILGKTTYYMTLNELARCGHIGYGPDKRRGGRSRVQLEISKNIKKL